ncbi:MAG: tetratricopeptide repeat protein [Nitrospira sp.]|nr:tetratricopeptide repeat protein [Nitrospira sp.]
MLLDGNRLFAEHRWTAAMMKYEEAIQAQPTLAETHYNLGMVL